MSTPFLTSTKRKPSPTLPLPPAKKASSEWNYDPNDAQALELQTFLKNGGILTPSSSIHPYNSTASSHGINSFISHPLSPSHDEERYNSLLEADLLVAVAASNRSQDEPLPVDPDLTHDDVLEGYVKDLLLNIPMHSASTPAPLPSVPSPLPPRTTQRKTARKGKAVAKKDRDGDYDFGNYDPNDVVDPNLDSLPAQTAKQVVGAEPDLIVASTGSATQSFDAAFPSHDFLPPPITPSRNHQPHASTSAAIAPPSLPASGSNTPPLHPSAGGMNAKQAAASFVGTDLVQQPCPWTDCDKKFARKSDFLRHYRIHTGERPFECKEEGCGKSFIQRSALTVHLRVHSGDKPHNCPTCQRPFGDSSSLARHRRVHEGLKPFKCEKCGKKEFNRKATLARHAVICKGMDGKSKVKSGATKAKTKAGVKDDSDDGAVVAEGEGREEKTVASGSGLAPRSDEQYSIAPGAVRAEDIAVNDALGGGGRGENVGRGGATRAASVGRNPQPANASLPPHTNLRARRQRPTQQRAIETDLDEEEEYLNELAQSDDEDDYDEYLDGENATGSAWHTDLPIRRPSNSNRLVQQPTSSHSSTSAGPVLLLLPVAGPLAGAAGANGTSATRTEVHAIPRPIIRELTDPAISPHSTPPTSHFPASLPPIHIPSIIIPSTTIPQIPLPTSNGSPRTGVSSNGGRRRTNGRATSAATMATNILNEEFFKTFIESDPIDEPIAAASDSVMQIDGLVELGSDGVVAGVVSGVSAEETAISTLVGGFGEQK